MINELVIECPQRRMDALTFGFLLSTFYVRESNKGPLVSTDRQTRPIYSSTNIHQIKLDNILCCFE